MPDNPHKSEAQDQAQPQVEISAPVVVKPPLKTSDRPDQYTKQDSELGFIPNGAPHQVFRFCRWGLEYGTDDKGHAASIILSVALVFLLLTLFLCGVFVDRAWITDALKILGTAFTFTAGVAIGKGSEASKKNEP
ncbi:hypothetical protein GGR95_003735 [Sulfitobacter undariae]|uniref:Uncharacterized protein n=1 Tax=Sulfitobacter undariae TaxID=1563671 RepID=A0A7W6E8C1_9RHOB|nr:hypothetical protein [Sulfitobacter undariae]MBB3996069.1 hypothetical protein [Sulfitobacter undariae]